jgi:nicotinamide riboside kinase
MVNTAGAHWRIAVCGSASVGKTSLVEALAAALGLPCIEEEMRAYLERSRACLSQLSPREVAAILLELWQARTWKEQNTAAFVADNCSLDFVAYALHYRCLTEEVASILLPESLDLIAGYDGIFVLPWGVLPYIDDGVRAGSRHEQLGYQLIIEGLLRRYSDPTKLHYLPQGLNDLASRCKWACSVLDRKKVIERDKDRKGVV